MQEDQVCNELFTQAVIDRFTRQYRGKPLRSSSSMRIMNWRRVTTMTKSLLAILCPGKECQGTKPPNRLHTRKVWGDMHRSRMFLLFLILVL